MRRNSRADANQPEIVAALRKVGAKVVHTHSIGGGFPDLVVGYDGKNFLIEVKTMDAKLNDRQVEFFENWTGQRSVARTPKEALRIIGAQ